jgi:lysophospholipid acyltransferase (LPLAT)-like uncharacterized protein
VRAPAWDAAMFAALRLARAALSVRLVPLNPPNDMPAAPPGKPVRALVGWRRVVLWPFVLVLKAWASTLRLEMSAEDIRNRNNEDEPVVVVVWHNRLFLVAELFRRFGRVRPFYSLVSASKDGAWLDAFLESLGMRTVRGSSSRLGREAVAALVEELKAGHHVGITPDGPRGPCYDFKAGALIVARRARAPLLLIGGEFRCAWRLATWDRFYVPMPFSRVRVHCEVIAADALADRDQALVRVRERLLAINPDR